MLTATLVLIGLAVPVLAPGLEPAVRVSLMALGLHMRRLPTLRAWRVALLPAAIVAPTDPVLASDWPTIWSPPRWCVSRSPSSCVAFPRRR